MLTNFRMRSPPPRTRTACLEQQAIAAREAEKLATALTESRSQKDECREQVTGFDRQILIGEAEKTRLSGEINRATLRGTTA